MNAEHVNQDVRNTQHNIQHDAQHTNTTDENIDLNNIDNKTLQEYLVKAIEYIKELQKQKNTLIALIKNESSRKDEAINENVDTTKKLTECNKKNKHINKKIVNIIFLVSILIILFIVLYIKTKNKICI